MMNYQKMAEKIANHQRIETLFLAKQGLQLVIFG